MSVGTIVVGYLPKPEGEAALAQGIAEAKLRSAKLILVSSHRGGDDFDSAASAKADKAMEDAAARAKAEGVEPEVRQLVRGFEASEDLLKLADEVNADLIVIGLRRRSPVGKLILGSNAQRILLDASCPVLAVKAK